MKLRDEEKALQLIAFGQLPLGNLATHLRD